MLIQKLEEFKTHSQMLSAAIVADDAEAISYLNQHIDKIWLELLQIEPVGNDEAYQLFEFFLGRIQRSKDNKGDAGSNLQATQRVLALTKVLVRTNFLSSPPQQPLAA